MPGERAALLRGVLHPGGSWFGCLQATIPAACLLPCRLLARRNRRASRRWLLPRTTCLAEGWAPWL